MKRKINLLLILSFLLCYSSNGQKFVKQFAKKAKAKLDITSYPKPIGWVNDFEHIYTSDELHSLDSLLGEFAAKCGFEIAVVSLDTGMVKASEFETYTLALANTWGVGNKKENTGILIAISKGHHKIRIQNGLGIEKLITDEQTKDMVYTDFIPGFRRNSYYKGTRAGIEHMIQLLSSKKN